MANTTTQVGSLLSVTTPLGTDVLLLEGFGGREAISEPFKFNLRMRSANKAVDATQLVGKTATVTVQQPTGVQRFFSGIVTRFANTGTDTVSGYYTAELAPRLWLLTLGRDRVIYQNLSALAIIQQVLSAFQVTVQVSTTGTYAVRDYCVQYDESAFHFISRLMEEEGIFYFFTFANGTHTMVLADSSDALQPGTNSAQLYFSSDSTTHGSTVQRIGEFEMALGLVESEHIVADYDYTTATTSQATSTTSGGTATGIRYTFPGKYVASSDSTRVAGVRLAAQQLEQQVGRGLGYCYSLTAGTTFTLSGHANTALNVSYVVRAVTHAASNDTYTNEFEVFPATVTFRPPLVTPRPLVAGTHTALVVGSSGEEIWTDAYGRIKVKFYWDRSAGSDQNSSCWVRVSQASAGAGWGHLVLPRVGQEVVVSYVDGDPDRPLVTGSVYNKQGTVPVTLPTNQTQSVMRSRSSKNGTAGNEIRMEDKLDSEELYVHAQKDMTVLIENALSTTVTAGAETHTLTKGDRTIDVQTGKETHTVKGTRTLDVTGDETHTNHGAFTQTVSGNYTLNVSGNLVIDVSGSISIKSGTSFANQAGTSFSNQAGTTLDNKAGTGLTGEGLTIEHKASTTQTVDGGAMLVLKGGMIKLN